MGNTIHFEGIMKIAIMDIGMTLCRRSVELLLTSIFVIELMKKRYGQCGNDEGKKWQN